MRIIQTVNDTIRLLFNPKTEIFSLSDFLLVRDVDENFLAQVIEVYDDKFDQEANVAKIKLIYRIVNGNEIKAYDNYTPSRECEVAKIKQSEIEKCINLNKKTIAIGKSFKTKEKMLLNTDFFDNNCVIFADKFEQTNQIFETLSPKLAKYKNVLILDFSGTCKLENAHGYCTGENFKLPLSSDTIDYIQQKILMRAKLETQVVLGDIFEEVKKFLLTDEENYIPYQRFIKVIQTQCKQTPSVELLVLISWLKKYAREGIFAKNKREFESLFKSIEKNKITTLDLSNLKTEWQKEHIKYILDNIKKDIFVLIRLNDNNINNDILNYVYLKKKNISFIPSFAYGYKKASYIMEFAQNYILLPTLNPKRDFTHADFQIASLNKESFMLFGEDTKDFIFTLELETPIKPKDENEDKDKLFISLNLQLEDMTPLELRPNNFEVKPHETRKKRLQEEIKLSDILGKNDSGFKENDKELSEVNDTDIKETESISSVSEDETTAAYKENGTDIDNTVSDNEQANLLDEEELDYYVEEKEEIPQMEVQSKEYAFDTTEIQNNNKEEDNIKTLKEDSESVQEQEINETNDIEDKEFDLSVEKNEKEPKNTSSAQDISQKEEIISNTVIKDETDKNISSSLRDDENIEIDKKITVEKEVKLKEPVKKRENKKTDMPKIKTSDKAGEEKIKELEKIAETKSELAEFAKSQENLYDNNSLEDNALIDDNILDAIDEVNAADNDLLQEDTSYETSFENTLKETEDKTPVVEETKDAVSDIIDEVVSIEVEDKITDKETVKALDELNMSKIKEALETENEIDEKFEEIINSDENENKTASKLQINEKVSIDLDKIKKEIKNPEHKLPVFDDIKDDNDISVNGFHEGDKISHEKYGEGEILKVIQYGQRCLLQIEFPEIGKRLLDPKIAKLKTAEEI